MKNGPKNGQYGRLILASIGTIFGIFLKYLGTLANFEHIKNRFLYYGTNWKENHANFICSFFGALFQFFGLKYFFE